MKGPGPRTLAWQAGWLFCLVVASQRPAIAGLLDGIGVIGDSSSDEHQFQDYSYSRGWVEQLATHRSLNFGSFTTTSRGEPRRQGYEYNWARFGDQSGQMISRGQHTGLASQVAAGDVTLAVVWIGNNDFAPYNPLFGQIYNNSLSPTALQNTLNTIYANIEAAYTTPAAAGPVRFVGTTLADFNLYPGIEALFPSAAGRARVSAAVAHINERILDFADSRQMPVIVSERLYDLLNIGGTITVGGVSIDMDPNNGGTDPRKGFVADMLHSHTITTGIYANAIIAAIHRGHGQLLDEPLAPFSDLELLTHAGLAHLYQGETFSSLVDLRAAIHYVPEPSTMVLLLMATGGLLASGRRRGFKPGGQVSRSPR